MTAVQQPACHALAHRTRIEAERAQVLGLREPVLSRRELGQQGCPTSAAVGDAVVGHPLNPRSSRGTEQDRFVPKVKRVRNKIADPLRASACPAGRYLMKSSGAPTRPPVTRRSAETP